MSDCVIEIQNLRVSAGRRTILSLEELSVERGEVFAVIGPNGAGKTTLLRTVCGFTRGAVGRVVVLGQVVSRMGGGSLCRLRRRIGYVPQALAERSELPLTLREVVAIGRQGEEEITAEEVGELCGTISYEILCGISARVPRVYLRQGRPVGAQTLTTPLVQQEPVGAG